jgi:hypothetical protein
MSLILDVSRDRAGFWAVGNGDRNRFFGSAPSENRK